MNNGTRSRLGLANPGIHPRLRARVSRYRAAFAAIGCTSNMAIARETGLDPKTIWNLFEGKQVGEHVMACSVAALQRAEYQLLLADAGIAPTLDSLFEVSVEAVA